MLFFLFCVALGCCGGVYGEQLKTCPVPLYSISSLQGTTKRLLLCHYKFNTMDSEVVQRTLKRLCSISDPNRVLLSQQDIKKFMHADPQMLANAAIAYRERGSLDIFRAVVSEVCDAFDDYKSSLLAMKQDIHGLKTEYKGFLISKGKQDRQLFNSTKIVHGNDAKSQSFSVDRKELDQKRKESFFRYLALASGADVNNMPDDTLLLALDSFTDVHLRSIYRHVLATEKQDISAISCEEGSLYLLVAKSIARGMDAHTNIFSTEEELLLRRDSHTGVSGISRISEDIYGYYIGGVVSGGAADMAGLRSGDYIKAINSTPISLKMPLERVIWMLKGNAGDVLVLDIERRGPQGTINKKIRIVRHRVDAMPQTQAFHNVRASLLSCGNGTKVGVLRFDGFIESYDGMRASTDVEIEKAIIALNEGGMSSLVIDLRNNGGGAVSQIPKIGSLFLDNGIMFFTLYKNMDHAGAMSVETHNIQGHVKRCSVPITILVSSYSASASECFAQAMKEYNAAIVVGSSQTFGKGSMQMAPPVPTPAPKERMGSQNSVLEWGVMPFAVTIGFYYAPSGYSTQVSGVKSDIVLSGYRGALAGTREYGERFEEFVLEAPSLHTYTNKLSSGVLPAARDAREDYGVRSCLKVLSPLYEQRIAKNVWETPVRVPIKGVHEVVNLDDELIEAVSIANDMAMIEPMASKQHDEPDSWSEYVMKKISNFLKRICPISV